MSQRVIVLENIRSGYNVGNIIRTADGLGREVWLVGYTPSPFESEKVLKTSLGAEKNVKIRRFDTSYDFLKIAKQSAFFVVAGEITKEAVNLADFSYDKNKNLAVVMGNEINGVSDFVLENADEIVYIPMKGIKVSFNVSQTSAIFMWELRNF